MPTKRNAAKTLGQARKLFHDDIHEQRQLKVATKLGAYSLEVTQCIQNSTKLSR